MHLLNNFIRDLKAGENLDLYAVVVLAIVFTALSALGLGTTFLPSLTLTLLALLSLALLRLFHTLETASRSPESRPIVSTLPDVADKIETANEIWISGISQNSLLTSVCEILGTRPLDKFNLKVLLADPDGHAIGMSARRYPQPVSIANEKSVVDRALERVSHLVKSGYKVEIKVLDHLFPEALLFFEPTERDGQLHIKYYTFQTKGGQSRPRETFSSSSPLYQLYFAQFQKMWGVAENWPKDSKANTP